MNVSTDNNGGTERGTNGNRMLPGVLLIGLGLLVLFTNLGLSIVGNLLTAAIFGGLAYYVYRNGVRTGRQGMRILAIPLAAGVLRPWGIVLNPAVGAVLMSASTVVVAINAQLLRRADFIESPATT